MRATIRLTISLTRALDFTAQIVLGLSLSLYVYTYIYICLLCLCNVRGFQGLHRISAGL